MAVTTIATAKCDLNTLLKSNPCFNCFSELESQAVLVYLLSLTVAGLSGNAVQTPAALRAGTACINCSPPETVADNMDLVVAQQGAQNAGSALASASIAAIKKAANPFRNMSLSELRSIEILLRCQLNQWI
jgi:hypothetical protein